MEVWVSIDGEKKKFQGSFKSVMESITMEGKGKEVKLLSIHAPKKELRRFKRNFRTNQKDLLKTATEIAKWFYTKENRKLNRCIKDYRKKMDPQFIEKVEKAKSSLEDVKRKLENLN